MKAKAKATLGTIFVTAIIVGGVASDLFRGLIVLGIFVIFLYCIWRFIYEYYEE